MKTTDERLDLLAELVAIKYFEDRFGIDDESAARVREINDSIGEKKS